MTPWVQGGSAWPTLVRRTSELPLYTSHALSNLSNSGVGVPINDVTSSVLAPDE